MASRIIHYAIGKEIAKLIEIKNIDRFIMGSILPDSGEIHAKTHFKAITEDKSRKYIDFHKFFEIYKDRIYKDDLYLGYYFHLIQDALYRKVLYIENKFLIESKEAFRNDLYNDYSIINSYLSSKIIIPKYKLIKIDDDFKKEYNLNSKEIIEELINDFKVNARGNPKYLSYKIVDDYIERAAKICEAEYKNIINGKSGLNYFEYSWENRK